jgi:ribose transport system permease protein
MRTFQAPQAGLRRLGTTLQYPSTVGVLLLVLMLGVNALIQPSFLTYGNLTSLFQVGLPLVLASAAQAVAVLSGGIDLSVGGILSLVDVLIVVGQAWHGFWVAVGVALAAATFLGLVNGVVVTYGGVQPLVATLATSFVASGGALLLLAQPGGSIPQAVSSAYTGSVLGAPVPVLALAATLLAWGLVRRRYGRLLYAVGGNPQSAERMGVDVPRVRLVVYVATAFLAGVAGLALTLEVASGDPNIGASYLLPSVAAVVLGGTSLAGGYGGLIGPMAGALALTDVSDIVFYTGVPSYFTSIVSSGVVLLGIALANNLFAPGWFRRWLAGGATS